MKKFILLNLIPLGLLAQTANTLQLQAGAASPPATLESVSWLRGEWVGEGLGGLCEEIWSSARGGSMLGIFRMVKGSKMVFSEFMEFAEVDGSILLRLKHFGHDFKGWEEKEKYIEFKLVKIDGDNVFFDGLTYRRTGPDSMEVYVVLNSGDTSQEAKFAYNRADP